ncbi:MAG: helix-hairpin-helix domain-containing protein [Desulfobacterales bacterium]|nr:helix-hairpin-helix domain-containing protein [Desulfobacterales bacterium]
MIMINARQESLKLLQETLHELESSKGSVLSGVQKLLRASQIIDDNDVAVWCNIQLGNSKYTVPLKSYVESLVETMKDKSKKATEIIAEKQKKIEQVGIINNKNFDFDQIIHFHGESGGGFSGIGFIEEKYADLLKQKTGNDGTYYKSNLSAHIDYVKRNAHEKATCLFNRLAFSEMPRTTFEFMKEQVDDKLLDLNPELAERLMIAFKSVSSENIEEWSHALTSCRRLIEGLADELFPPIENEVKGRKLGKNQYINRLWAFMDQAIESDSNKALAKAHVDFLGSYIEKIQKINNKGVHAALTKMEAVKTVFHTYLMLADLLDYLAQKTTKSDDVPNIHTVSLDELESCLGVSRKIAKQIIKLRVESGSLTPESLNQIHGIGPKTISKANAILSFEIKN